MTGLMKDPQVEDRTAEASTTPATVLLVEDEAAVREFVRKTLEYGGYKVLEAKDGYEALAVIARNPTGINLVLTDVVMPGMSGWLMADTLATKYQTMRVLFMSGNSELVRVFNGGTMEGATLHKPFTPATLLERVRQALDSDKTR
jgi:DNA-binding response OmpR family regulator